MQSWLTWLMTGLALALAILLGICLIGLARLAPNLTRWFARSALAAAMIWMTVKLAARACQRSE
jgi:hypothetical protein